MVDTHAHISLCEPPADELLAAANAAGVRRVLEIGLGEDSNPVAVELATRRPDVFAAVGRHPNGATGFDAVAAAALLDLSADPAVRAIGETGLDFYRDTAPREDQERAFRAHIELARDTDKPLVIHTRAADDDTLAMLSSEAEGLRVILHCFSMADRIEECVANPDWWISFAGNVTYPSAAPLREAALRVPAARLLVETDAPYLAPQPVRGKRNQPANVVMTAQALAVERRVGYDEFEAGVQAAAAAVFGW